MHQQLTAIQKKKKYQLLPFTRLDALKSADFSSANFKSDIAPKNFICIRYSGQKKKKNLL